MNRFLICCLLLTCSYAVTALAQDNPVWQKAKADSAWFHDHYHKQEVMIPMRDGIKLFTSLYIPNDASKTNPYPFLMTRTPYNCAPYGPDKFPGFVRKSTDKLYREGFIIVHQDVRGRWGSEGKFIDERPEGQLVDKKKQKEPDESTDTYDTIDWLLKNIPGNNGKVGVYGVSYPGFYSTAAALSGHPALKAVSPQAPVTDWFVGDDWHHGGAFFWADGFLFMPFFSHDDPKQPDTPDPNYHNQDNYDFFLHTVKTAQHASTLFPAPIPYWDEVISHPTNDEFWKSSNPLPHAVQVKPAMLEVGGWFDAEDLYGTLKTYRTMEEQNPGISNRLVMGPWSHGGWWGNGDQLGDVKFGALTGDYYVDSLFLPFMRTHLKGDGKESLAEATVFETGANRWHKFPAWPPKSSQPKELYLQAGEKLSFDKPASGPEFSDYVSDPNKPVPYQGRVHFERTRDYMLDDQRFAARRPDVLVFSSDTLRSDLTIAGPITADLQVSISTTDADFVVKVIDVYPNDSIAPGQPNDGPVLGGYQQLVRAEIIRGRFRNSWEKPEAFVPGQVTPVHITLPDAYHTFKKGHRLMVQVQSSWFPLVDRNPQQFVNTYTAQPEEFLKSTIRVYHTAANASHLTLPVLSGQ